ncbi:MAG TPA: hypothetical protein VFC19_11800 [Candidatus Limnocylindrales bacterium]|nr:hypothetical protein [Candidatus Limnocylindrales bacterium]
MITLAHPISRRDVLQSCAMGGLGIAVSGDIAGDVSGDIASDVAATVEATRPDDAPIRDYYLGHGGAAGMLGTPASAAEATSNAGGLPGLRQDFQGILYGAIPAVAISIPEHKVQTTCRRPDENGTVIESTVAWSAHTGTHSVRGDIRDLWLELGGESGTLGYPTSDEIPTTDGRGRRNRFEHGEIWWYPETGAHLPA